MLAANDTEAEEQIKHFEKRIKHIRDTRDYIKNIAEYSDRFTIKKPLYKIRSKFSAGSALHEYRDHVLPYMDSDEEDILSNMVRKMTFNDKGYLTTEMCIVKAVSQREEGKAYHIQ